MSEKACAGSSHVSSPHAVRSDLPIAIGLYRSRSPGVRTPGVRTPATRAGCDPHAERAENRRRPTEPVGIAVAVTEGSAIAMTEGIAVGTTKGARIDRGRWFES